MLRKYSHVNNKKRRRMHGTTELCSFTTELWRKSYEYYFRLWNRILYIHLNKFHLIQTRNTWRAFRMKFRRLDLFVWLGVTDLNIRTHSRHLRRSSFTCDLTFTWIFFQLFHLVTSSMFWHNFISVKFAWPPNHVFTVNFNRIGFYFDCYVFLGPPKFQLELNLTT